MTGIRSAKRGAINAGAIIALATALLLSWVGAISNADAQGKAAGAGPDEIRTMLLRPGGWLVEWRGASQGELDFVLEDRGEKVVVQITNAAWNMSCERDVTITPDDVKLDGCRDTGISLKFDPDDPEYPFKGESRNVNYKLKEK